MLLGMEYLVRLQASSGYALLGQRSFFSLVSQRGHFWMGAGVLVGEGL